MEIEVIRNQEVNKLEESKKIPLFRNDKITTYQERKLNNGQRNRLMWKSKENFRRLVWFFKELNRKWKNENVKRFIRWSGKWNLWKIIENHSTLRQNDQT